MGNQKGWLNTYYYNQDGSSGSRSSGDIYTSFQKAAKIWWDPWQGGDGAIFSSIDGSGSGSPIAEVNNCSRVIKYVVTLGQRYSTHSLVDMRVHDVNVVADLTRHDPMAPDPEEPVVSDGTSDGSSESAYEDRPSGFDGQMNQAASSVVVYWTGPWPECHVELVNSPRPDVEVTIKMKVDLMGTFTYEPSEFTLAGMEDMTEEEAGRFVTKCIAMESNDLWSWIVFGLGTGVSIMLWIAELIAAGLGGITTPHLVWYCVAIGVVYLIFLWATIYALRNMGLTETEVQQAFIGITLNAICVAGTAIFMLQYMPQGLRHMMNYFKGTYARSLPGKPGCVGRGNVVVLLTTAALIAMTVVAFVGLVEGWW